MRKKQRLLLGWSLFGALTLALCAWAGLALLAEEETDTGEGLVPGVTNFVARSIPASAPGLRFERIDLDFRHFPGRRTHRLPEDMGSGVAAEDFDGDGRIDLFFVNNGPLGAPPPACALFQNAGGLRFEKVDAPLPALHGMGAAAADYDSDGDFDLYVTGYGRNVLLRNEGGMVFRDVTEEAGVEGGGFSAGACWGDADGDGDLDLYVCRYVVFDEQSETQESLRGSHTLPATLNPAVFPPASNLLFLNEGGGRFREAAAALGIANPEGKSLGALFADFDGDGVLDLYVANDVTDNVLYQGRRGQPYADRSHPSCTADWRGAMGLAAGDPDGDGDLDLFITHWKPEENALYVREEGLLFRDDSFRSNLGEPSRGLVGWACEFSDLDRDGRPDLWVVNGDTFEEPTAPTQLVRMRPQLFWNGGDRFFDLAPRAGAALQRPIAGRGGISADLDGDGDLDLVIVAHGDMPLLLRNDTETGNHHLAVEVRGSEPNVFAYGATVLVEAGGTEIRRIQPVGAKVSYLSSGPHALHFGLGRASHADRVVVRFPSGKVVERRRVRANTRLVVKEVDARALGPQMDRARDLLAAGREEEARDALREVVRLDPAHTAAIYQLAQLEEPAEALALCVRLDALEPMAPRGRLLRAQLYSDPRFPDRVDLEKALRLVEEARHLNRDETGGVFEEGRIRVLQGDYRKAAEVLRRVRQNPRAASLAALCLFRLGRAEEAMRLLQPPQPHGPENITEEGDTAQRKAGQKDLLGRLLIDLGRASRWELQPFRVTVDENTRPNHPPSVRPYSFSEAAAWALRPPELCRGPPPGTTATQEADVDGDGDQDLLVVCGGDDPTQPLPWWLLLKEEEGYRPIRGGLPYPGCQIVALEVRRAGPGFELLLRENGGGAWVASLR